MDWQAVRVVIFDLDGTLYRQTPVRLRMAMWLFVHVLTSKTGWHDVLSLLHYRQDREKLGEERAVNVFQAQFGAAARACRLSERRVAEIVHEWIEIRPLELLRAARYPDVDRFFAVLRQRGIRIGIFSDYPVEDKLVALGLEADLTICSTDRHINRLKPEPAGLLAIMNRLNVGAENCLMIGDRMDRDGLCAAIVGMPFLLRYGQDFFVRLSDKLE